MTAYDDRAESRSLSDSSDVSEHVSKFPPRIRLDETVLVWEDGDMNLVRCDFDFDLVVYDVMLHTASSVALRALAASAYFVTDLCNFIYDKLNDIRSSYSYGRGSASGHSLADHPTSALRTCANTVRHGV